MATINYFEEYANVPILEEKYVIISFEMTEYIGDKLYYYANIEVYEGECEVAKYENAIVFEEGEDCVKKIHASLRKYVGYIPRRMNIWVDEIFTKEGQRKKKLMEEEGDWLYDQKTEEGYALCLRKRPYDLLKKDLEAMAERDKEAKLNKNS